MRTSRVMSPHKIYLQPTVNPRAILEPLFQENEPSWTKVMEYVVSTFKKFQDQLDRMEKNQNRKFEETLNEIKRKGRLARMREKPRCFPWTMLDDLLNFQDVDQETYDNVVSHFIYLGGINPIDSAGHYFKCAFGDNEEIPSQITWLGTNFQRALKGTRFAEACEDAMAQNPNYRRPDNKEFENAMSRALKSTKERRRKYLVATNAIDRRCQKDPTADVNKDVLPVRRLRVESVSPIRDDNDESQETNLETTFAIDEIEDHSQVDEQHSYEKLSNEEYFDDEYEEQPLNDENEGIAEQEDFIHDYRLTTSDFAKINEFDRRYKKKGYKLTPGMIERSL